MFLLFCKAISKSTHYIVCALLPRILLASQNIFSFYVKARMKKERERRNDYKKKHTQKLLIACAFLKKFLFFGLVVVFFLLVFEKLNSCFSRAINENELDAERKGRRDIFFSLFIFERIFYLFIFLISIP